MTAKLVNTDFVAEELSGKALRKGIITVGDEIVTEYTVKANENLYNAGYAEFVYLPDEVAKIRRQWDKKRGNVVHRAEIMDIEALSSRISDISGDGWGNVMDAYALCVYHYGLTTAKELMERMLNKFRSNKVWGSKSSTFECIQWIVCHSADILADGDEDITAVPEVGNATVSKAVEVPFAAEVEQSEESYVSLDDLMAYFGGGDETTAAETTEAVEDVQWSDDEVEALNAEADAWNESEMDATMDYVDEEQELALQDMLGYGDNALTLQDYSCEMCGHNYQHTEPLTLEGMVLCTACFEALDGDEATTDEVVAETPEDVEADEDEDAPKASKGAKGEIRMAQSEKEFLVEQGRKEAMTKYACERCGKTNCGLGKAVDGKKLCDDCFPVYHQELADKAAKQPVTITVPATKERVGPKEIGRSTYRNYASDNTEKKAVKGTKGNKGSKAKSPAKAATVATPVAATSGIIVVIDGAEVPEELAGFFHFDEE